MTLREYIAHWQETYDKHQSRPTTYAAHDYIFKNHILSGLGDIHLSDLTESIIGAFLEERKRFGSHRPESPDYPGLGENSMRHIHRLLQQCLDQAIRDGIIESNPAKAFRYPKPKKVNANVLTPLEMEDYLDAAERLGYLPMFLLALTADLRHTCAVLSLQNGMKAKDLAQMLGHSRTSMTRQNYIPFLAHRPEKDEDTACEATQEDLLQAANIWIIF